MNIRVDLDTTIKDGTEVVFRSPVDCSQVTGLKVYYKKNGTQASQEFAFADAHGNNVGDIDHLFAENVVVKVILDVTTGMAFVQNADTNAYLEGRFSDIENKLAHGIACEASGSVISVSDSSNSKLNGLTLYGKTTQNGTPSPSSPIPLVSAGDSGTIKTTVCGKNLIPLQKLNGAYSNVTVTTQEDGRFVLNGTANAALVVILCPYGVGERLYLPAGTYTFSGHPGTAGTAKIQAPIYLSNETNSYKEIISLTNSAPTKTVTFDTPVYTGFYLYGNSGESYSNVVYTPSIELGSAKTEYEPYKGQTLTTSTPNGLPGIPVASGGNYTDENGQQWICDEIDFSRGVYVKRIGVADYGGNYTQLPYRMNTYTSGKYRFVVARDSVKADTASHQIPLFCTVASVGTANTTYVCSDSICYNNSSAQILLYLNELSTFTAEQALAWLQEKQVKIQYLLAEPVETALSADELAQYATLHTNKPNTTVYTDANAGIRLEYIADTKTYIDNKFAALAAAIVNNA